jgi:uncharacterized surface protein with fasciclin (FAS1) repeats
MKTDCEKRLSNNSPIIKLTFIKFIKLAFVGGIVSLSAIAPLTVMAEAPLPETGTPQIKPVDSSLDIPQFSPENTQGEQTQPIETPAETNNSAGENLVELAKTSGFFGTLAQAVEAAGLTDTLSQGNYTLFAPTDEAFSASLPSGTLEFLLKPENKNLLREVLQYHVVQGEVSVNELKSGRMKTLGGSVSLRVTPEKVVVNNASITQPNIKASNGVIHAVNRVLLPRPLRDLIASRLSSP